MARTPPLKCPKCGGMTLCKNGSINKRQRWACFQGESRWGGKEAPMCYTTTNPDMPARDRAAHSVEKHKDLRFARPLQGVRRYVITSAQNATPVHEGFLATLNQYCKANKAALLVIPYRYRNPTSQWTESQENADFWNVPKDLLYNQRHDINENLVLMGDVKIQPTAVNPLAGFEGISAGKSAIFGHSKLQLKTVAVPQGKLPKILTTTGAVTVPNFVNSRQGKLGEFHHVLGATLVEVQGKIFHMRQLLAAGSSGGFYDLDHYYDPAGKYTAHTRPLSLTMGDTHVWDIDPQVEQCTFQEIVPQVKPLSLVYHDLLAGTSANHHTDRNPFVGLARAHRLEASVRKELEDAFNFVENRLKGVNEAIIVPSNHNDWIHYWLMNTDWRTMNPFNRRFYLQTALTLCDMAQKGSVAEAERLNAFIELAKARFKGNTFVRVLDYDESCMLGEIEHGLHGHLGPNGNRGNLRNLRRIGVKVNIGHVHTSGIDEGGWSAGTSTRLRLGYNRGPSGWLNSHILTYANSKRTFLHIIGGKWRL